jgi:hypothetical protein
MPNTQKKDEIETKDKEKTKKKIRRTVIQNE